MKTRFLRSIAVVGLFSACMMAGNVQAASIAIALVPTVIPVPAEDPKTFVLEYDANKPDETPTAKLTFDLQAIPSGVTIESAILRLVPSGTVATSQQVRIFGDDKYTNAIGQLITSPTKQAVESTGAGLVTALKDAKQTLDLYLRTSSIRTSQRYHSDTALTSANRPRLIISWTDTAPPIIRAGAQLRYRGNPDDVTPWRYGSANGAMLSTPLNKLQFNQILAGPVFRGDEIIVIATPRPSAKPVLYGVNWNGNKRWEHQIPQLDDSTAGWKYLHVDTQDRLLAFRNDGKISIFDDFGDSGPTNRTDKPIYEMKLSKRPVVSAGGTVTFRNDNGYVYSLSPSPGLRELWRSDTNVGLSPPPVLSPRHGNGLVYVIAVPDEGSPGLLVFDAARGDVLFPMAFPKGSKLSGYSNFHPPFVVAGTDHDWVFLSGFGESTGVLEGYTDFTKGDPGGWKEAKNGPISRCVAPPPTGNAEPVIYCVQGGKFRGFRLNGSDHCVAATKAVDLSATSNLVADGAGNIYFWNEIAEKSGVFYGFSSHCVQLFSEELHGLPKKPDGSDVLELRVGPNGVLYAMSNTELFAIQPTQSGPAVAALAASTRYATQGPMQVTAPTAPTEGPVALAASGTLSFGKFQVPAGADVTCSAGKGISFGAGFAVKSGGVLRCGIESR